MSQQPEQWPPVDLINGLAIEAPPVETELDSKVLNELPDGTEVVFINPSGASAWVQTLRIDTIQKNGERKSYFKKVSLPRTNSVLNSNDNLQNQAGSLGRRMMLGSFESDNALCTYIPDNIPKPVAWGNYESNPDMYFYLAEFHDMVEEVPDPIQFVDVIVKLHRGSSGKSPDGKFGFHVPTHLANIPNKTGWKDTWEETYSEALYAMMEIEAISQGTNDDEFEELKKKTLSAVVPRLLRPLETGGRKVTPCLLHTDLWPGNCMPDADTDNIILFDSCAMWGHNEADLGSWRAPRYRMGLPFLREYQRRVGMNIPVDDWDDRNQLYALRYDLLVSALFPNTDKFRNYAREAMKLLLEKHQGGFEAWSASTVVNWVLVI